MILFDLDGTLANCEHRRHFVDKLKLQYPWKAFSRSDDLGLEYINQHTNEKWKPDWKAFYEACEFDEPIQSVIEIFHDLHRCERKVQIWSGRCESVRQQTVSWLKDKMSIHFCSDFCLITDLKMRPIGDNTPDELLKERWLDELIINDAKKGRRFGELNVEMVFDDRPKVVRMWRRRSIFVFDVNQTREEF